MRIVGLFLALVVFVATLAPSVAEAQTRILWFNGMADERGIMSSPDRERMVTYLNQFEGGQRFQATYVRDLNGGGLANALSRGSYDLLVLDLTDNRRRLDNADTAALQRFFAGGQKGLMLDGSLYIRSIRHNPTTRFPGPNNANADILVNQLAMLAEAGGGILIGTDHGEYQRNANIALQAIVPDARFTGRTNPSTNGDFIGAGLLSHVRAVTPRDILRHWESVPSQGEAPVGTFTTFDGFPITLYSLVEAADKPGRGRKIPYVSFSEFPGAGKTALDADQAGFDNLPTHKSGTN